MHKKACYCSCYFLFPDVPLDHLSLQYQATLLIPFILPYNWRKNLKPAMQGLRAQSRHTHSPGTVRMISSQILGSSAMHVIIALSTSPEHVFGQQ